MVQPGTRHKMFRLAKQMKNDQKVVVGAEFITRDDKILTCARGFLSQWRSYFSNLLYETNPRETEDISPSPPPPSGWRIGGFYYPGRCTSTERDKTKKSLRITGLTSDMIKFTGDCGLLEFWSNPIRLEQK